MKGKRVGYWLHEKKIKKLNFQALAEVWIEVVQLRSRDPDVIIHKLTDVILEADQNDSQSLELVHRFQEYINAHPETIVLDSFPAIRTLLDHSKSCKLIWKIEIYMEGGRICLLPFMEVTSLCGDDTMWLLEKNGLAFPFMCKTRVAHGTNSHEMSTVFNQEGLNGIQPPCVVFVVSKSYTVVQRPFHSVSKPESSLVLMELDKIEGSGLFKSSRALGVLLFGTDIIINNQMGQHAVIDINAFPAYEGVSRFFTDLWNHIATIFQDQSTATAATGDVAPLRHSKLLAKPASSLAGKQTCSTSHSCCSRMMGQDAPWKANAYVGSTSKLPHPRLCCTTSMSVASLANKASSQYPRSQDPEGWHGEYPLG
uniref:Inositol-tetrakisphosphate 1-kinase n=1 Tax=Gorilla gorilla gorilla TaxID=9595 RepID=A0A2I2Y9I4_GORGO